MSSLVLDLKRDALDRSFPVSDLLRKSLVVARKLGLDEFERVARKELEGYSFDDESEVFPPYRQLRGVVKGYNPFHGWQPVLFGDSVAEKVLSSRDCAQSIPELEHLLESSETESVSMDFDADVANKIRQAIHRQVNVTLVIPRPAIAGIVEAVRTVVLNWALELEEKGVLGEGMSFTPAEREKAESTTNVNNFYGNVTGPSIQQGIDNRLTVSIDIDLDAAAEVVAAIRAGFDGLELGPDQRAELESDLATLEAQFSSPSPKKNVVREVLDSVRRILEGAGGAVAAQLALELAKLLT
jgi:hypothetical protein